jgi:hypothetical protein
VHAVEALNDRLLNLVEPFREASRLRIDAKDRVVVDLGLEVLRPAAIAAKPWPAVAGVSVSSPLRGDVRAWLGHAQPPI